MKTMIPVAVAAAAAVLLSGCSTPAYRIRRNPELFASFPPDVQEKVRHGRIEIGFDQDMVRLALGRPRRVYARETADGRSEMWAYVQVDVHYDRYRRPDRWVAVRDAKGQYTYHVVGHRLPWRYRREYEYERLRVEFRDGRVVAIETLQR